MATHDAGSSPPTPFELSDLSANFNAAALDITADGLFDSEPSESEVDARWSTITENSHVERDTCVVCGDRAPGRNFGVASCGSCKAFFRRNALKSKISPCLFSGSCSVTKATRSFCPPCRLKKCLAAGMKTDRIMSQEAKKQRKELIQRNRRKELEANSPISMSCSDFDQNTEGTSEVGTHRSGSISSSTGSSSSSTGSSSGSSRGASVKSGNEMSTRSPIAQLAAGEFSTLPEVDERRIHGGASAGRSEAEPPVGDGTAAKHIVSSRSTDLFQHVKTELAASTLRLQRRLISGDEVELGYLARKYQSTVGVDPSIEAPEPPEGFSAQLFATRTSNLLRQMVLFAKETPHFAGLSRSTQIRLLRAGAMPCILLRSAELLDLASGSWVNQTGDKLSLEVLKQMPSDPTLDGFFGDHLMLSASVKQLVPADAGGQSDGMVFALLLIIVLLSPEHVVGISDSRGGCTSSGPAVVADSQVRYVALLRRHLEATHSFQHCARVLPALLQQISVLKRYSSRQNSGFMSCLAVRNNPLCQEVLGP